MENAINHLLESRWKSGAAPFDGDVLWIDDVLHPEPFAAALAACTRVLRGERDLERLYWLDDWHAHDGFLTAERPCTWADINEWTSSTDAVRKSSPGDFDVYRLIYPADLRFCLRYRLDSNDDSDADFNVCADVLMLDEIAPSLRRMHVESVVREPAKPYFDRKYAG